jgi:hypothetical protein
LSDRSEVDECCNNNSFGIAYRAHYLRHELVSDFDIPVPFLKSEITLARVWILGSRSLGLRRRNNPWSDFR